MVACCCGDALQVLASMKFDICCSAGLSAPCRRARQHYIAIPVSVIRVPQICALAVACMAGWLPWALLRMLGSTPPTLSPNPQLTVLFFCRMDLLRAAVAGAAGTPYHDQLFFFDVQLPPEYPHVPPLVQYHSWGMRANPNLVRCVRRAGTHVM